MIKKLNRYEFYEKKLRSHIVFAYNNLDMGEESFLGYDFVNKIDEVFSKLHKYNRMILALNSNGGNLASGARLINILKSHYKSYDVIVCGKCSSASTFVAMGARRIICTRKSIITPAEPQLEYNGKKISISVIRNLIEQSKKSNISMQKIDWYVLGSYFASKSYFEDLCLNYLGRKRAQKVIEYMISQVNSHQYPITENELKGIGIDVKILEKGNYFKFINEKDRDINEKLKGNSDGLVKEKYLHIIVSSIQKEGYVKVYESEKNQYRKIFEGFRSLPY